MLDEKFLQSQIRNFCIIAHIDHGKSTLADRLLELTGTVEKRKMREQFLDQMELERERGITIKMQPVRMLWHSLSTNNESNTNKRISEYPDSFIRKFATNSPFVDEYILNLIDTPGHIDFSYEVSRALRAVEGAVLLVDATQGIEAQTITNVEIARSLNLTLIPVINKIDIVSARREEVKEELKKMLHCGSEEIFEISAKTGQGVGDLLAGIVNRIPPPAVGDRENPRALIFDYEYSFHKGVIAYVRVTDGIIQRGGEFLLSKAGRKFIVSEVGIFKPELQPQEKLAAGEIGYVVTNIKKPGEVRVGDSIVSSVNSLPSLSGYREPEPVVWAGLYPESQDDFSDLKKAVENLHLIDGAFSFEMESAGILGRGFRCGFLGILHLEIIIERIKREFKIPLVITSPTVLYRVLCGKKEEEIYSPDKFPLNIKGCEISEPWVLAEIVMPPDTIGRVIKILNEYEAVAGDVEHLSETRVLLKVSMPLREMMRNFFDDLKSISSGRASFSYKLSGHKKADVLRLDVIIAGDKVPAFSKIIGRTRLEREAESMVEKLYKFLPRSLFAVKIQAEADGRIIRSRALPALRKDVTGYLYGGDRTRKMKLWEKQRKGKKRLQERGSVQVPHEVFLKMLR